MNEILPPAVGGGMAAALAVKNFSFRSAPVSAGGYGAAPLHSGQILANTK